MSDRIFNYNFNNVPKECANDTSTQMDESQYKKASIFVDSLGDSDGELTEKDFEIIEQSKLYIPDYVKKYIEACKQFLYKSMTKVSDNYVIETTKMGTEAVSPMVPMNKEKQVYKDKISGKTVKTVERSFGINSDGSQSVRYLSEQVWSKYETRCNEVEFSYSRSAIEDYVINSDQSYFKDIKNIRNKPKNKLTEEDNKKLSEFNSMIDYVIESGVEYGVDPNLITSIIRREVKYNGNKTGKNGQGYMQLTSIVIQDYLGLYEGKYYDLKDNKYGPELKELLLSRGFNPDVSASERGKLAANIFNYLAENNDKEFNIRLGTLVLRNQLNKNDGDAKMAAYHYNGNASLQKNYAAAVDKFYKDMVSVYPSDSLYRTSLVKLKKLKG